jgi:hypothetical protein
MSDVHAKVVVLAHVHARKDARAVKRAVSAQKENAVKG